MSSVLPSNVPEFETKKPPSPKRRAPIGGIVVTVILALALIAIIVVAVSRLSSGGLTRPNSSPAASSPAQATAQAGQPADAATAQAIQQVITAVNQAQVQAVQSGDPSGMSDTATPEFYQDQVANNQDLIDNGVTDIKLVNIEWGPVLVSGNTAVATTYETWSTTFQDGTTEQSRDRNVYTLINDNGTWKVQSDDHPDQQASSSQNSGPPGAP